MVQLIEPYENEPQAKDNAKLTSAKVAETFNTNRTYVSDAGKIKEDKPE